MVSIRGRNNDPKNIFFLVEENPIFIITGLWYLLQFVSGEKNHVFIITIPDVILSKYT